MARLLLNFSENMAYCMDFISRNGYIRVGYATKQCHPEKKFQNDVHKAAFYNSVSARLVNTGKYVREECKSRANDYDILLNPAYFHNKSIQSSNRITRFISLASVAVAALTFITSLQKSDEGLLQQIRETNQILQSQEQALIQLNTSLQELHRSTERAQTDSASKK